MKTKPIQTSFAGGEVTDLVLGRSESVIYQQGAEVMENFIPDSRGPGLDRGGTEYLDDVVSASTVGVRVQAFQVSGSLFYNLEFSNLALHIRTPENVAPAVGATFVTVYTNAQLRELRFVPVPAGNVLYVLHENVQPYKLTYTAATDTFTFAAVTFTSKPASWTGTNWPAVGAVFQGRLWLGRTPSGLQTFWASASGTYEDFSVSGTPVASDAILGVVMEHFGAIQWMIGTKTFVIGTLTGEYIVKSDTGVISAQDIQIERQSSYGSAFVEALMIGNRIFHVSAEGRKIRMMEYAFSKDNWVSDEASYFADHITENDPVLEIHWLPNPDSLLFAVLESGSCIYFTWEAEAEVHGWSPYNGVGTILSASSGLWNGRSVLTLITKRVVGLPLQVEITRLSASNPQYYMDCFTIDSAGGGTSVTGLPSLYNGLEVQVLTDGAVHPPQTPVGGAITLQWDATVVVVGFKYTPKLKTLPIDTGSAQGSSAADFKMYNKFIVRLIRSAMPLFEHAINYDEITGATIRPPTRHPTTPMGTPEPLITQDVELTILGWDRKAQIHIEQDLPLPLNIASIFGELSQENF